MRSLLVVLGLLAVACLPAQIGVIGSGSFPTIRSTFFDGIATDEALKMDNGYEVGLNYWFRLPTKRVEFMPTIYYGSANYSSPATGKFSEVGVQFKTNIYPFDFGGDCDCPTFGKQGPQLQKGFFLQLSPGYALYRSSGIGETDNRTGFTLGGGVGLDIGLSNLVTITPVASVRHGFSPFMEVVYTDINGQDSGLDEPKLTTFLLGLQLSFRLDHKRY